MKASAENAAKVVSALRAFGAPLASLGVTAADFTTEGRVVQLGLPPLRIDILTTVSGVDFETAKRAGATIDVEGRAIPVIGLDALMANKRAAGRPRDLLDVSTLQAFHRGR